MPGQVERQRPVALRDSRATTRSHAWRVPLKPCNRTKLSGTLAILASYVTSATDTYLLLRAFVDELARCGMRAACTSPGSRSAPLALTLARERRLRCYSHIDERCAGFFALGLAKASGLPVAVTCTSGTAVANLLPAAIEAREARVPLLLLSADRPPELRENGAGQAIDQLKLFGSAAKWFFEVGTHDADDARLRWMRTLACRAYATAAEGRPGVVHLNFALREPLVGDEPLPSRHDRPARRRRLRTPRAASPPGDATPTGRCTSSSARPARRRRRRPRRARAGPSGRSARPRPTSPRPPAGRCWPTRCRARAAAAPRWRTTTRCCATSASPPRCARTSSLRVGDLPVSKPLRTWLGGLADVPPGRARSRRARGRTPRRCSSHSLAIEAARGARRARTRGRRRRASRTGWRAGAAATSVRPRRSSACSATARPASRPSPPSSACCCRSRRRCSSPPRCPCATSRRSGRFAPTRRACCATAAPTASTAPSPAPSARPPRATARSCC